MTTQTVKAGSVISVMNVTKVFDGEEVVHNLSFEVEPGRIFGLIGPSGCGKTTTVRLITGVYQQTRGKVQVMGRQPSQFSRKDREKIGYLPQHFVLYRNLDVTENMEFVAGLYGLVRRRNQRIREALEFVELWDSRKALAGDLSGGMQRRLGLAAALVHEPVLLFVDEPTAGIDPVLRAKFWDGFRTLRDAGHTIFMTTQYVTEADYCDQVAVMRSGELLIVGTPGEVRRRAVGGDSIEMESGELDQESLTQLRSVAGVRQANAIAPGRTELVVDDADVSIPEIQRAAEGMGLGVKRLRAHQANFDEVFVRLMEQADSVEASGRPEGEKGDHGGQDGRTPRSVPMSRNGG